ncbi:beta-N-acetylhexosaminidase [Longimicrobium sp.]|uniref:beta-N-acetylhexosaminidase n=1 Tax=Longimicrobium sp. TaxID=2029185 RepID=UPI002ED950AA
MPMTHHLVPVPLSFELAEGGAFAVTAGTRIVVDPGVDEAARIGEYLGAILRPSTGHPLPVSEDAGPSGGSIALRLMAEPELGDEGYRMAVSADSVRLSAHRPAGLFRGVQTLRQLLPAAIEAEQSLTYKQPWSIPAATIADRPRFAWRGAMLDVARHFFSVDEVKEYVDALALYKINVLHLHLSDDQGWRIAIDSRPRLAEIGGSTQVGGGPGGFYTKRDYAEIVRYAAEHYITVVPEIDVPGHTNAALVAYPELSCGKRPPAIYTGIEVGFSALCVDKEETYALIDDIVRELAAMTPGPYLHIGGDEVEALTADEYARFIERVQEIVARHGKRMIGWEEIAKARLHPTSLVQQWRSDSAGAAVRRGARVVLSPASRIYLDMKYTPGTELGLNWAGHVEVRDAYDWNPAAFIAGVGEEQVAGLEAPLWTETVTNITAAQYLAFPRLPAVAELGWSPAASHDWESFRLRLAAHAPRWHLLGINYYRSPQVPWPE